MVRIDTSARPDEVEDVWFGDDGPYKFTFPKIAPLVAVMRKLHRDGDDGRESGGAVLDAQEKWLSAGFEDQWPKINARLEDMGDALDWSHMTDLFDALFEAASERPPTSPGGSSGSSAPSSSGGSAKPAESTTTS